MPEYLHGGEQVFRGIAAAPGVSRGKVLVLGKSPDSIPKYTVQEGELPEQTQRLEQALVKTRHQILEVQRQVSKAMGAEDASIFEAHLLVLEDSTLIDEVVRLMRAEKINVEYAFHQIAEKYATTLGAIDDEYLRERASDMRDVTARILNNLLGRADGNQLKHLKEPVLLISHDLSPSTTAMMDKKLVLGFATDVGSRTSHTAIMARSLQIPAVVGLGDISRRLGDGQYVLLDGYNGVLILNPTDQTLFEYGQVVRKRVSLNEKLKELQSVPAVTLDGHRIILSANLEQPEDTEAVISGGAEGVGLFRTEYLFINREHLPDEEEQYRAYSQVAAALNPHPLVIRTLDLGGDKFVSHLQVPSEINPFLGWRAIRFCLQERGIFRAQLRAILRASTLGNVKMMYPMISGLKELEEANQLVEEYKEELRRDGIAFDESLEIGMMVEIPSAALEADSLAKRARFFSLGTNDLIQYTLAVDRLNEKIAHLYEPSNPAIVKLIKSTLDAAHENGIWGGLCGEMASDLALVPLLLGLGVDELSVAAPLVPQVKFLIRRLQFEETKGLAEMALGCECGQKILQQSKEMARRAAPGLFEDQK